MSNAKITVKEAIMIILTIIVSHTMLSFPRILLARCGSSILINIFYVTIIALLLTLLICKLLKKFPGYDLLDISHYLGGNRFKNIIGTIFIAYFVTSSGILLRNFCEGLIVVSYPMTNVVFLLLVFMIAVILANQLGFHATIKTNSIILPIMLTSVVFLFVANFRNFTPERIFPILGNGFYDTFILGLTNICAFGGISCIYFLPPLLKEPEKLKKISFSAILITGIYLLICVSVILFIFTFFIKVDEIMPLYSAARYIEFGAFFQRLESVFLLIWIFGFACYVSIACKFSTHIFQKITNLKNVIPLTAIFGFLIFGIALVPKNYATTIFFETHIYPVLVIGIVLVLGISILLLAHYKKKKKEVNQN